MQVYTDKLQGTVPERNQGQRVVLDLEKGLKVRKIISDNFSQPTTLLWSWYKREIL